MEMKSMTRCLQIIKQNDQIKLNSIIARKMDT